MDKKTINVYLADDHELVAKAIAGLLLSIEVIGDVRTFSTGKALFYAFKDKAPDLVILDIEMPEWNGMQTLEKLREISSVPVLVLSMNDERAIIEEVIKLGAQGFIHKNCSTVELQAAIESAMKGNIFLSEEIKKIVTGLKPGNTGNSFSLTEPLTEKEYEVLKLICEGLSSKEIGEKLFLSPRTIETRKESLMDKFNVRTTGKLIALAIKNKIVR